jgi:hypothetical protein
MHKHGIVGRTAPAAGKTWRRAAAARLAVLVFFALVGAAVTARGEAGPGTGPAAEAPASDLARLAACMTGSFSSFAQAQADSDYFDIRLEMAPVWLERSDAIWLYVEQARADHLDRPYRQRVYRVSERADGALVSEVYTLPSPLRFAGAFRQERPLAALSPDSLTAREGCAIVLRPRPDGSFAGATEGRACPSDLRGAAYATSEVVIRPGEMVSWDRGFDAEGKQVWGATKGGYVFRKAETR